MRDHNVQGANHILRSHKSSSFAPTISLVIFLPHLMLAEAGPVGTLPDSTDKLATYSVQLLQISPPKISVTAKLPLYGRSLSMERTRPGDIVQLLKKGWPAFIHNLRVSDNSGSVLAVDTSTVAGWELKKPNDGWVTLEYEVDFSLPDSLDWPAPRELAFRDSSHFVVVGRSLFMTTSDVRSSIVMFSTPSRWSVVTPWLQKANLHNVFIVGNTKDLTTNLVVFTKSNLNNVTAAGFSVDFTPLGHWDQATAAIEHVLQAVIPFYVNLMEFKDSANYSIVLLPSDAYAGEAYRNSFAFTIDFQPSDSNVAVWGQTIAHEIFHYWNGLRLRGSDYSSTQWFQEGFTDYVADLAMVNTGLITSDAFREKLLHHIQDYQILTTALDSPGNQKGPPLYSGGALVAFCWDVEIRSQTGGRLTIDDFLRKLWRLTNAGEREYGWKDIRMALDSTVSLDWNTFYQKYIKGTQRLPIEDAVSEVGLRLVQSSSEIRLEQNDIASRNAKSLWESILHTK